MKRFVLFGQRFISLTCEKMAAVNNKSVRKGEREREKERERDRRVVKEKRREREKERE